MLRERIDRSGGDPIIGWWGQPDAESRAGFSVGVLEEPIDIPGDFVAGAAAC